MASEKFLSEEHEMSTAGENSDSVDYNSNICQLCLQATRLNSMVQVGCENSNNLHFIEVELGFNLPEKVCKTCADKLRDIVTFIKKCKESYSRHNQMKRKHKKRNVLAQRLVKKEEDTIDECIPSMEPQLRICQKCGETVTTRMREHYKKSKSCYPKNFKCPSCDLKFMNQTVLNTHQRTYHWNNSFVRHLCHICSRMFKHRTSLVRHLQGHSSGKTFICEVCGKSYSRMADLKNHINAHSSRKLQVSQDRQKNDSAKGDKKKITNIHVVTIKPCISQNHVENYPKIIAQDNEESHSTIEDHKKSTNVHTSISKPHIFKDGEDNYLKRTDVNNTSTHVSQDSQENHHTMVDHKKSANIHTSTSTPQMFKDNKNRHPEIEDLNNHTSVHTSDKQYVSQDFQENHQGVVDPKKPTNLPLRIGSNYLILRLNVQTTTSKAHIFHNQEENSLMVVDPKKLTNRDENCSRKGGLNNHTNVQTSFSNVHNLQDPTQTHNLAHGETVETDQSDGTISFSCAKCKKEFPKMEELVTHMQVHSEKRISDCQVKNQKLGFKKFRQNHVCSVCSKSFLLQSSLQRHMHGHSVQRPSPCPVCGQNFKLKSQLRRHINSIHKVNVGDLYSCQHCGEKFNQNEDLKNHELQHLVVTV